MTSILDQVCWFAGGKGAGISVGWEMVKIIIPLINSCDVQGYHLKVGEKYAVFAIPKLDIQKNLMMSSYNFHQFPKISQKCPG